jgi:hypothetical protein
MGQDRRIQSIHFCPHRKIICTDGTIPLDIHNYKIYIHNYNIYQTQMGGDTVCGKSSTSITLRLKQRKSYA